MTPPEIKKQTQSLNIKVNFKNMQPQALYKILTSVEELAKLSIVASFPSSEPSGTFSVFDGKITGKFIEVVPNERIKLYWRLRDWSSK